MDVIANVMLHSQWDGVIGLSWILLKVGLSNGETFTTSQYYPETDAFFIKYVTKRKEVRLKSEPNKFVA